MNTEIYYLYRDASNYKNINREVIHGTLSDSQINDIMKSLSEGEYFIPRQVGLPEARFGDISEDDHCWFELSRIFTTDSEPTLELTAEEMYKNFIAASGNWDETAWLNGDQNNPSIQ